METKTYEVTIKFVVEALSLDMAMDAVHDYMAEDLRWVAAGAEVCEI